MATFEVASASRKNNCNQNCQEGCQFGNPFPLHLTSLDVHPDITETHNHKARISYLKKCKGMKEENKLCQTLRKARIFRTEYVGKQPNTTMRWNQASESGKTLGKPEKQDNIAITLEKKSKNS